MEFSLVRPQQGHAALTAGNQYRLKRQLAHEREALSNQLLLGAAVTNNGLELVKIRRNERRTAILFEVAAFGVDNNRFAGCAGGADNCRHVLQGSLGIVGDDHHLRGFEHRLEARLQIRDVLCIEGLFEVHAQQLLMLADHAQLGNSGLVLRHQKLTAHARRA